MAIKIGQSDLLGIKIGSSEVLKVMFNKEIVWEHKKITLRNIEVGDDLSRKILYCDFPDYFGNWGSVPWYEAEYENFIQTNSGYNISYMEYWSSAVASHALDVSILKDNESFAHLYTAYRTQGHYDSDHSFTYNLPEDFGNVSTINPYHPAYPYIKVNDEEVQKVPLRNIEVGDIVLKGDYLLFDFPDVVIPDQQSPSISKQLLVEFENGYIYYQSGYQYSTYTMIWVEYKNSTSKEFIYIYDGWSNETELNLKELKVSQSLGQVIWVEDTYYKNKNDNNRLLTDYIKFDGGYEQ